MKKDQNGRSQTSSISLSTLEPGPSCVEVTKKLSDMSAQSVDSEALQRIDSDNDTNLKSARNSDADDTNLKPTRDSDASQISEAPRRKRGILEPLAPFESARSAETELPKYEKDEQ